MAANIDLQVMISRASDMASRYSNDLHKAAVGQENIAEKDKIEHEEELNKVREKDDVEKVKKVKDDEKNEEEKKENAEQNENNRNKANGHFDMSI